MGKKKGSSPLRKGGGAMLGMRAGFKGAVGQQGRKKKASFWTVIGWVGLLFLIGVVAWLMGGIGQ
jgi:hypothetical protein